MSKQVIDAYYAIKHLIHHSMSCLSPVEACNCGVDDFKSAIATLEEQQTTQVPEDTYYSTEHQTFFDTKSGLSKGILFWNVWRQYAKHFPQR